jgi:hypothetical protein
MSDGLAHEVTLSFVETAPAEIDAGMDLALKVRVSCSSGCDLRGRMVRILAQGAVVKEMGVELTEFDGEATETAEFVVKAPAKPGEYTWTVVLPALESETESESELGSGNEGAGHAQGSVAFGFTVKAHQLFISIWGIPSPVTTGAPFVVSVGVQCSARCSLGGLPFEIVDSNDERVAAGRLWPEALAQTRDLYWAEQELVAPMEEGLREWTARFIASDAKLPHEATARQFPFFAARPPDHVVTVEVVDKYLKTPLKNAFIFMDRRRASTNEQGIARVEVSAGRHELQVARDHYQPYEATVDVAGDTPVSAELVFDPDVSSVGDDRN